MYGLPRFDIENSGARTLSAEERPSLDAWADEDLNPTPMGSQPKFTVNESTIEFIL